MSNVLTSIKVMKLPELNPEHLPLPQFGFLNTKKGKSIFLSNQTSYQTVILLEFLPHTELRGKHFHLTKQELLYIIEGKLEGYFWVPKKPDTLQKMIFSSGDLVTIPAQIAHAYKGLEKTLALELSTASFDPSDTSYEDILI